MTCRPKSTKAALAFYAFALRRPSECLEHLAQVKDLAGEQGFQGFIPPSATGTTRSAATLNVPGAGSNISLSSSWTGSFVSAQSTASIADINEGRAWSAVERIRSICLKGACIGLIFTARSGSMLLSLEWPWTCFHDSSRGPVTLFRVWGNCIQLDNSGLVLVHHLRSSGIAIVNQRRGISDQRPITGCILDLSGDFYSLISIAPCSTNSRPS